MGVLRYLAWAAARSLSMKQLYEEWLNAVPVDAQWVEPPPAGYEKIEWIDGKLCMEHPKFGMREDIRRDEVDALRSQGWQARIRNQDFCEAVHQQAWYFQARWFPRLRWAILDTPPGACFIIGDRPIVWGVQRLTDKGWSTAVNVPPYYLRDPHVQLVAPLTRSIALLAFHASSPAPAMVTPHAINRIVVLGAQRWVFGPTEATVWAAIEHEPVV